MTSSSEPREPRRAPNPWIMIPSVITGVLAGVMGWFVTDVSCRQMVDGVVVTCPGWRLAIALVAGIGATLGIMVLLVLVFRSLAEHAARQTPE